jgi:hypothetical protein
MVYEVRMIPDAKSDANPGSYLTRSLTLSPPARSLPGRHTAFKHAEK